jgi:hypothetical protein
MSSGRSRFGCLEFKFGQPVLIDIVNRFLCDRGTTSIRLGSVWPTRGSWSSECLRGASCAGLVPVREVSRSSVK